MTTRIITEEDRRRAVLHALVNHWPAKRLRLTPGQRKHIENEGKRSLNRRWRALPWYVRVWFRKPYPEMDA